MKWIRSRIRRSLERIVGPMVHRVVSTHPGWGRLDGAIDRLERSRTQPDATEPQSAQGADPWTFDGELGERACVLLGLLEPVDIAGARYERIGRDHDGGYVMLAGDLTGAIAYSLGIGDDASWDVAMAERGYTVHQFDHTIDSEPVRRDDLVFTKTGICGFGEDDDTFRSLDTILRENGHLGLNDLVLKIDTEGAEWIVFSTILDSTLCCFSQIVVEFHCLDRVGDSLHFARAFAALSKLRAHFEPVHVHANNNAGLKVIGGIAVPPVLEVTYVRKGLHATSPCMRSFPAGLDQPNARARPDLWLGSFKYPLAAAPAVTRDEIRRAYRLVLGREPEGEAAYKSHAGHRDYDALLATLLNSREYREKQARLNAGDGAGP